MTITNRALNDQLTNLETCAEKAPEGTYVEAKAVAELVGDTSNALLAALESLGMKANNGDGLRDLEAAVYGYVKASNPEAYFLPAAEGFGVAMGTEAAERVLAQTIEERDRLAGRGGTLSQVEG